MRARMALHYAGIQCAVREVVLKNKPQAMLDVSPKGTVPVLHLPDGEIIDESLDIMLWALSRSDSQGWFQAGGDSIDAMPGLIHHNDSVFKFHLDRYKYSERFGPDTDVGFHFSQAAEFLRTLETCLAYTPCLFGATASLADVAIFPFVRQFAAVDHVAYDGLSLPHVQAWLNRWLHDDRFASIMLKHKPWQAGEAPVFLIPKLSLLCEITHFQSCLYKQHTRILHGRSLNHPQGVRDDCIKG